MNALKLADYYIKILCFYVSAGTLLWTVWFHDFLVISSLLIWEFTNGNKYVPFAKVFLFAFIPLFTNLAFSISHRGTKYAKMILKKHDTVRLYTCCYAFFIAVFFLVDTLIHFKSFGTRWILFSLGAVLYSIGLFFLQGIWHKVMLVIYCETSTQILGVPLTSPEMLPQQIPQVNQIVAPLPLPLIQLR
eukprot:TRINITY_DN4750_c0_g1_i1.p1 TRINITY_DN4750_c0_g1~~TRINITY_DN4750_c0_g1_i1.p1  ORF type:complete len:189 (+),score=43.98 TRINITY_DN4750_c0_g1_i1:131-697(+)